VQSARLTDRTSSGRRSAYEDCLPACHYCSALRGGGWKPCYAPRGLCGTPSCRGSQFIGQLKQASMTEVVTGWEGTGAASGRAGNCRQTDTALASAAAAVI